MPSYIEHRDSQGRVRIELAYRIELVLRMPGIYLDRTYPVIVK